MEYQLIDFHPGKRAAFLLIALLLAVSACIPAPAGDLPEDTVSLQEAAPDPSSPPQDGAAAIPTDSDPASNPSPTAADPLPSPQDEVPVVGESGPDLETPTLSPTEPPPTVTNPPPVEESPPEAPAFSGIVGTENGLYLPQDLSVIAKTGKIQFLNVYANW